MTCSLWPTSPPWSLIFSGWLTPHLADHGKTRFYFLWSLISLIAEKNVMIWNPSGSDIIRKEAKEIRKVAFVVFHGFILTRHSRVVMREVVFVVFVRPGCSVSTCPTCTKHGLTRYLGGCSLPHLMQSPYHWTDLPGWFSITKQLPAIFHLTYLLIRWKI